MAEKKSWYYNPETLQETYSLEQPAGFIKGRLPYKYWSEERKNSYKDKHKVNSWANMDLAKKEEIFNRIAQFHQGHICYTNGKQNIYLHPGQDIPEGFYKGCYWVKSELYKATRTGRKKGSKNKYRRSSK